MSGLRLAALAVAAILAGNAQAARPIELMSFPGGFNWPLWVATDRGFASAEGLEIHIHPAPGSVVQMKGLAAGTFDIAISTIDNVIAYDEGQGEVAIEPAPDFFAFMGAQYGAVRLVAQSDVYSIAELRDRSLAVDAETTGYAFVLRKLLQKGGLERRDYRLEPLGGTGKRAEALMEGKTAATILTSPLEVVPESRGFQRLANAVDEIGPYQALVGVARRGWARDNPETMVAFIRAYVRALDWLCEPANRDEAVAIYRKHAPAVSEENARLSWDTLVPGPEGFERNGRLDRPGIETVLALRREFGKPGAVLGPPEKYVDETYLRRALP
ncbi:MAG TPA: ABC transporter substrate-binding protein [Usitatibacter sp.]|nr:ABC transporter substrate-binding protein [Usitatibacter sp.]